MVESLTVCTLGILGLILKIIILVTIRVTVNWNKSFDRVRQVTLEVVF